VIVNLASRLTRVLATGRHYWAAWTPDSRRVIYQESPDADGIAGMS